MSQPVIEALFQFLQDDLGKREAISLFAEKRPLYIYGAGNIGKDVHRVLTRNGIPVTGFLDRNASANSNWEGISIQTPDDPSISAAQRIGSHVVIGIFNRDTEMPPIVNFLKSAGYGRVSSFLEVHDSFASELGDRFWLTSRSFYKDNKKPIATVYDLWSDQASRDLFSSVLKFRFEKNYEALPKPDFDDQYFPVGLPAWPDPARFIDCGAFDGDTLRQLMDGRTGIEAIAAFEPDSINFLKLSQSVRSRAEKVTEAFVLLPCGVSSETSQIRFSSGQGSASCAAENGDTVIQCVKLDDALPVFRPTVIKMDIEGAEYAALMGARRIIEQHHPGLAISVYHQAEHLWTIPLLAQDWLKGGRHYLRMHAHNAFELIYYWMP